MLLVMDTVLLATLFVFTVPKAGGAELSPMDVRTIHPPVDHLGTCPRAVLRSSGAWASSLVVAQ